MKSIPDPSVHRERERQLIEHVERLLGDERLRVDTTRGRRPVASLRRQVHKADREVELKRLMDQKGKPDRELQSRMPVGRSLSVALQQPRWLVFRRTIGRLHVVSLAPSAELLDGTPPRPLDSTALRATLAQLSRDLTSDVPTTLVVLSTSGFTLDAHEVVDRRSDRTLILVEPNDAGGWSVHGPAETKALVDLFDPEADELKRKRIVEEIDRSQADLLSGGLSADRLAAATQLPLQMVEAELKTYARANPGLAAKRLDGRVVLFRDGNNAAARSAGGGNPMPFLDRLRALFARKGETEQKVALLSERRAALSQQRDIAYEELAALEKKEAGLRQQFKETDSSLSRRRITSQLLQLRKDMERRQQLMGVLNQQVHVVSTHLHNLQLVQQGQTAALPDAEELAQDAAAAEEMLERLSADAELAGSLGTATAAITAEEQALYDELLREAGEAPSSPTKIELADVQTEPDEPSAPQKAAAPAPEKRREAEPG